MTQRSVTASRRRRSGYADRPARPPCVDRRCCDSRYCRTGRSDCRSDRCRSPHRHGRRRYGPSPRWRRPAVPTHGCRNAHRRWRGCRRRHGRYASTRSMNAPHHRLPRPVGLVPIYCGCLRHQRIQGSRQKRNSQVPVQHGDGFGFGWLRPSLASGDRIAVVMVSAGICACVTACAALCTGLAKAGTVSATNATEHSKLPPDFFLVGHNL